MSKLITGQDCRIGFDFQHVFQFIEITLSPLENFFTYPWELTTLSVSDLTDTILHGQLLLFSI